MSFYTEFTYPVSVTNSIGLLQSVDANIPLIFNSIFYLDDTYTLDIGFATNITLTAGANLSAVTFTISGYQNGVRITENIVGPNANTVISVNYYDKIISIVPLQTSIIPISIGTYRLGFSPLLRLNTLKNNVTNLNYSLHISVPVGIVTIEVYKSLKDCYNQGIYDNLITNRDLVLINTLVLNATSQLLNFNDIASNLIFKITANAGNRLVQLKFMQL